MISSDVFQKNRPAIHAAILPSTMTSQRFKQELPFRAGKEAVTLKTTYDAIIIGAGIIGAATASQLAESGYKVILLERGEAASGASGGNLGQISLSDRCEPWHLKLALRSLAYYREVLSQEFSIEYNQSGGSTVLLGPEQIAAAQDAITFMNSYGIDASICRGEEIHQAEPAILSTAMDAMLYCPMEGKLNPFLTTLAFLEKAKRSGAVLLNNTPVIAFEQKGNRIDGVRTPQATYHADWIINCTGPRAAYLGKMANVPIPICFHKGTAFVSQPVAPLIKGPVVSGGSFLAPPEVQPQRSIGFGTVQTADGSILIAQSTEECDIDDKSVNMPSLQLVAQAFLNYFPQLKNLQIVRAWAAVTTYTKDRLPVFGFSNEARNFFTVAGFKGAFTTAPAIGALTKAALEGHMDPDLIACAPDREPNCLGCN